MKTALLYGEGDLRIEETPIPEPGCGEALVRVTACGVCPTDVKRYTGAAIPPHTPFVLGHEAVGVIEKLGPETGNQNYFKVGDKVIGGNIIACGGCNSCRTGKLETVGLGSCENQEIFGVTVDGGFREYTVMPLSIMEKMPEGMPDNIAALTEPISCCLNAIEKADIQFGETVLIIGGGFMGLVQLQLAKLKGAKVIVSDLIDERLETARKLGADLTVNPEKEDLIEALRNACKGSLADVVMCLVGSQSMVEQGLAALNRGGRLVILGGAKPGSTIAIDPNIIHYNQLKIIGSVSYTKSGFVKAIKMLADGKFAVDILQSEIISLEELEQAFIDVTNAKGLRKCVIF